MNGIGIMPACNGMKQDQIQTVALYVATAAGRP